MKADFVESTVIHWRGDVFDQKDWEPPKRKYFY